MIALRASGVGKRYRIGQRQAYSTLRETLMTAAGRLGSRRAGPDEFIWALDGVSFEIGEGEVVGIIGRNGAGKSTLLKILSRITDPTRGEVELRGRVAALLEVGTGFHPELTGRENIYLSGAILGMKRAEIARNFDAIVAFAELEKFVDTEVKHFSSGMYTRLAFAVAAHLETDILLVDEVLAVGDAEFQRRCLGKMEEVQARGRTVLFVSHNIPAVLRICRRVLLLDKGKVKADGDSHSVTRQYIQSDSGSPAERVWMDPAAAPGDAAARLRAVRVRDETGAVSDTVDIRRPLAIEVEYSNLQTRLRPSVVIQLVNEDGTCLFAGSDFNNAGWWNAPRERGRVKARCTIPGNFLAEGRIFVLAALWSYSPDVAHFIERDVISFQVVDQSTGDGVRGPWHGAWPGVVRPMLEWNVVCEPDSGSDGRPHEG
jgi:lipopolysaccharide transport system ATP-binding protein